MQPIFLLTNDDGVNAEGIAALARAAQTFGEVIWIAPSANWSVCGHKVTTHEPIRAERLEHGWKADGTPGDCVRLGIAELAPRITHVISGINHGGNLGADVFHSGTVAAVREAALHGRPGIAFSHYRKRARELDWNQATEWARRALDVLLKRPWQPRTFWNVNLPHPDAGDREPKLVDCPLDLSPLPLQFRVTPEGFLYDGNYHLRAREPGGDVDVCFRGDISMSPLEL